MQGGARIQWDITRSPAESARLAGALVQAPQGFVFLQFAPGSQSDEGQRVAGCWGEGCGLGGEGSNAIAFFG